jgi:hypothetical protein
MEKPTSCLATYFTIFVISWLYAAIFCAFSVAQIAPISSNYVFAAGNNATFVFFLYFICTLWRLKAANRHIHVHSGGGITSGFIGPRSDSPMSAHPLDGTLGVLFSGLNSFTTRFDDLWVFDPSKPPSLVWSFMDGTNTSQAPRTVLRPGARDSHCIIPRRSAGTIIIFGGQCIQTSGGPCNDM